MEPEHAKRPTSRQLRRAAIAALAEREKWPVVDAAAWDALRAAFGTVSERTLHHDLLESGFPLHPLVEGVRLDTMENLLRTLTALADCHRNEAVAASKGAITQARRRVLEARRKAEAVLANPKVSPDKRAAMEEKFLWLRTWLENPELFTQWAPLRLRKFRNQADAESHPKV